MNNMEPTRNAKEVSKLWRVFEKIKATVFSIKLFQLAIRLIVLYAVLSVPYWAFFASDRYVSEANVIIQKTDQVSATSTDLAAVVSGLGGPNRGDQLLLREYLLSVDMLEKLDATLHLRSHFSDIRHDFISRMWFHDEAVEWFYRYWLSRVEVVYDEYSGALRISAQAYDPETAHAIVTQMVREGEAHMNRMGHELAQAQVDFLATQVTVAQDRLVEATHTLINFQNKKGLMAPQTTAESLNALIDKLEVQKVDIQTQLASLPTTLNSDHPTIGLLKRNLKAIDDQISKKRSELAAPNKQTLNYTIEEFQRLELQVGFVRDLYKSALGALEKGRMDAARTLKKVSILQAPTTPVYPLEPARVYHIILTLLVAAALIGVLQLLKSIMLDHLD